MVNVQQYFAGREAHRQEFLKQYLREPFKVELLDEHWATRRYFRVTDQNGQNFVLMESLPDDIYSFTPGHKISDFVRIGKALHAKRMHVPEIFFVDEPEGYALIEDFGDLNVGAALDAGQNPTEIYKNATDILIGIRRDVTENTLNLPSFYDSQIYKTKQRIVDWYIPATRRAINSDDMRLGFYAAWDEIETSLPPCPQGFVHGDYHAQNLMWLGHECGVLDFQAAMWGPPVYDLANLLEDIRRDVPQDVHDAMLDHYCHGDDRMWFRVLATQFHCKVIGQILRLAIVGKKPQYLKYMPRIQNYIITATKDPVLAPFAKWLKKENIDLTVRDCFNPDKVQTYIRPDAV